ncbi:Crp/Fnr family transcriptional regulator [Flavobacterium capsici]|uniref:Crp/Fnr family transcriptional regulator n=1 Tax=Flavobacterium capsici TaxID=3075618 RepID=A0AA96J4U1_9FLAO|nr:MULTISPECIES: Crp/Fnr family transcriptional regulator [unclassified Flavobacterium]WNM19549.1 Crp/Fnr family transcriptional regulator [Flavobacterium sp. PMR2A8]WNM20938.1 Crp/Fnr family transcriptional regulator [Flavobacterium sp. PMTSA4]
MKNSETKNSFLLFINQFIDKKDKQMKSQIEIALESFLPLLLKKNEFLVRENEICTHFCYIESGILQHAIEIEGEEKTTYLGLRNSVTSSLKSFLDATPSQKNIKALVDTQLLVIDLKNFRHLLQNNAAFHQFYFKLIEKQIMLIDDYRIDLLTLSPEERYHKLLITEPKLLQEVPLHYLASFLGISNRHMSRIRKNIK